MRLQGKTAIVTGAASGFGEGIAKTFAREGAKVVVADLNEDGAKRVAGEIGANAVAVKADVTKAADVERWSPPAKRLGARSTSSSTTPAGAIRTSRCSMSAKKISTVSMTST